MNVNRQDDQTLWFRNLPQNESDDWHEKTQESAEMEPQIELFIEPLTGLTIPIYLKNKNECV